MSASLLILDDEDIQARNLTRDLRAHFGDSYRVQYASEEAQMLEAIAEWYYNVAIVDLRMDAYAHDGIALIRQIAEVNPYVDIIVLSAYANEFAAQLTGLLQLGRIRAVIDKGPYDKFLAEVIASVEQVVTAAAAADTDVHRSHLDYLYATAKSAKLTTDKGELFERFVVVLFGLLGFNRIERRQRDKSSNEVDLLIRNEQRDPFLAKFGPYILVECKNEKVSVDKNTFVLFKTKLDHTSGLSSLGIIVTARAFKRTAYLEAIRHSHTAPKVLFFSNLELVQLINSTDRLETFKTIFDQQVKDN